MKKWSHNLIFLFLFIGASSTACCQDMGEIRFGIDLEGELRLDRRYFEIQLVDTLLINQSHATLPAGYYEGEVWAPGFERQQISFKIETDQRTDLMVYMKYTDEYLTYKKELPAYIKKGKFLKITPLVFTSLFAVGTVLATERMTTYQQKIYLGEYNYPKTTSVSNMVNLKNELYQNTEKYNQYRIYFYSGIALTGVSIITAIWTTRYFNRRIIKPSYNKVSPFQTELVFGLGLNSVNLTLKL